MYFAKTNVQKGWHMTPWLPERR